jgi:hypothetical protein
MTRKTKRRVVHKSRKTHRRHKKKGGRRASRSRSSRRTRRPSRRRRRRRQRGGMLQLSPVALPPGGPYVQGATDNGLGKGYYYKNNINPYLPDPAYNNSGIPQKGGKRRKKSKHRKKKRAQKGGFFIMENLPGGTDIQQAWWQVGNHLSNTYQAWKGGKPYISPSPSVQPIGQAQETVPVVPEANIPQIYSAAQKKAAKFKA